MTGQGLKLAMLATAVAALTACGTAKVTQEVEMPARESGMIGARKVAVFNINGDRDGAFTAQVESYVANVKMRGKSYFEVLERQMLERIVAEQKMVSSTGLFNESDAVKLGNLAGADTLIMGSVKLPDVVTRNYTRSEPFCAERSSKGDCLRVGGRERSCVERTANVDFTLKAVSVQKGSIIFTKSYSGKANSSRCEDEASRAVSDTDLLNAATKQTLDDLRKDIAPYTTMVTIEFMEKDDTMNNATRGKLKNAMEFVEQKRIDRACQIFKEALAGDTNSPALYYNLGVCEEISADLDRAESLYGQADRKAGKPVKLISEAINRVKQARISRTEVGKQVR